MKIPLRELPNWPAAMNQQMAAAYCGISVETFIAVCPVIPIHITKSNAGKRYRRARLDEWLESLDSPRPAKRQGMRALWDANGDLEMA
jgi:hypothetical protein